MPGRKTIPWGAYAVVALVIVGVLALNSWLWGLLGAAVLSLLPAFALLVRHAR
jgi:hypothetical protein